MEKIPIEWVVAMVGVATTIVTVLWRRTITLSNRLEASLESKLVLLSREAADNKEMALAILKEKNIRAKTLQKVEDLEEAIKIVIAEYKDSKK